MRLRIGEWERGFGRGAGRRCFETPGCVGPGVRLITWMSPPACPCCCHAPLEGWLGGEEDLEGAPGVQGRCLANSAVPPLNPLRCHKILAGLRGSGATGYSIPRGFLFNYITCANYFAEIWSWVRGRGCGLNASVLLPSNLP